MILLGALGSSSSFAADDKLSKKDKRWLEREVGALITAEEVAIFEELDSKDRKLFKEIFWARRDPSTMTPDNEVEEEFKKRMRVADDRFESQGRSGSATDMGKILILLGTPEDFGELWHGNLREDRLFSSSQDQTWKYAPNSDLGIPDGLTLEFRPQGGFGYRLVRTDEIDAALARVKKRYTNPSINYRLSDGGRLPEADGRSRPQ